MPLEIRELQIKVNVNQPQALPSQAQPASTASGLAKEEKQTLIQECIDEVLNIFNHKKER